MFMQIRLQSGIQIGGWYFILSGSYILQWLCFDFEQANFCVYWYSIKIQMSTLVFLLMDSFSGKKETHFLNSKMNNNYIPY